MPRYQVLRGRIIRAVQTGKGFENTKEESIDHWIDRWIEGGDSIFDLALLSTGQIRVRFLNYYTHAGN